MNSTRQTLERAGGAVVEISNCIFPDDLLYDAEENVWVKNEPDGIVLGITSVYAFMAGRFSAIRFKPRGTNLEKGKSVATVESPRFFGAVRTPISGRLVEVHQELLDEPSLANKAPYTRGWFARISPTGDGVRDLEGLVGPEKIVPTLRHVIEELHVRCFSVFPDHEVSGIGGECPETLRTLEELMNDSGDDETVHLVTDNPTAGKDVPEWVSTRRYRILEERIEGNLHHFIIGKEA